MEGMNFFQAVRETLAKKTTNPITALFEKYPFAGTPNGAKSFGEGQWGVATAIDFGKEGGGRVVTLIAFGLERSEADAVLEYFTRPEGSAREMLDTLTTKCQPREIAVTEFSFFTFYWAPEGEHVDMLARKNK